MGIGRKFSETCNRADYYAPQSNAAATYTSSYFQVTATDSIFFEVFVGDIASTGTVAIKIEQAQDSSGTGVKDCKTATTLTDTDDDKIVDATVDTTDIDSANSFTHVRLNIVVATAASLFGYAISRYWNTVPPLSALNSADVAETI